MNEEFGNASSTGLPVLLDVTTVKGTLFNLLIKYDDLWAQTSMFAKCRQKRLFVSQITLFNQKGEIVTQKKTPKEVFDLKPDGASYRAMRLVCKKKVRGRNIYRGSRFSKKTLMSVKAKRISTLVRIFSKASEPPGEKPGERLNFN